MRSFNLSMRQFFSGTLLSRISGLGRDLSMAFAFGDHPSIAAFMIAFRFSNLFRRLLGEGPFQSVFIPHYEGLKIEDPSKAALFFRQLSFLLVIVLLVIIGISEIAIGTIPHLVSLSASNREILTLTGWMLPGLLFICLYGLNLSLLNCHNAFFTPSFAPFICNTIWILAALFLPRSSDFSLTMVHLAQCIILGFAAQWLVTLPLTVKYISTSLKQWVFRFSLSPEIKKLFQSFTYGIIGISAVQFNTLIDSLFARAADLRGPAYLWYAIRLEQLILAIFGIACVSTIVPSLSRAIKSQDWVQAQEYFSLSLRRILSVMIPSTFAIFVLGGAAVNLLYGRGHFSIHAIVETILCLWSYALGLVPTTLIMLFSALFYAQNNFKTPMFVSLASVCLNSALNGLFVFGMGLGAVSTALATSLSAWVNGGILLALIRRGNWKIDYSFSRLFRICLISFLALLYALIVDFYFFKYPMLNLFRTGNLLFARYLLQQFLQFAVAFLSFGGSLWLCAGLLRSRDLLEIFSLIFPNHRRKVLNE